MKHVNSSINFTKVLEPKNIKPIIVGGLSVEIYTQNDYIIRCIDFVSEGYDIIQDILLSLQFQKEGRHFYYDDIEVAIEVPDSYLAESKEKIIEINLQEDRYIYVRSVENIILDK